MAFFAPYAALRASRPRASKILLFNKWFLYSFALTYECFLLFILYNRDKLDFFTWRRGHFHYFLRYTKKSYSHHFNIINHRKYVYSETNHPKLTFLKIRDSFSYLVFEKMKKLIFCFLIFLLFISCTTTSKNIIKEDYQLVINEVTYVAANPGKGFNYGYYYYIPESINNAEKKYVLVEPNNTGFKTNDMNEHDNEARNLIFSRRYFSDQLSVALLVPVLPNPESGETYTHALDSDTLRIKIGKLKRIDLQLISMIDDLKERCQDNSLYMELKIFLNGFSASGGFVNRFTAIHPELVKAVSSGGNSSTSILPTESLKNERLIYPVGIANLKTLTGRTFDFGEYKKVPQYIYIGSLDTGNDPVPNNDMFNPDERRISKKILGENKISRWQSAENIIKQLGCDNITFVTYPNVGHRFTDKMWYDTIEFFKNNM